MDLGFVGLGAMGREMAGRLLDAGHDVAVFNRTPARMAPLTARGARGAESLADAARHGGLVLTMLANDAALREVALGPEGLIASLPSGGIHVAMGTHSLDLINALAEAHAAAGQWLVAAPVLGRPEAVAAGRLGIVVAGADEALRRCRPALEAIGPRIVEAGSSPAAAASVKIANNMLLACAIEALGEAFALTDACGVDADLFLSVITGGLFACPAYATYGGLIATQRFEPAGFTAALGLKDVNLALAAGLGVGVALPAAEVCRDGLADAVARGQGDLDWAVMSRRSGPPEPPYSPAAKT